MKRILCFLAAAVTLLVACVCTSSCTSLFSGNEKGVYSFSVENVAYVTTDSRRLATAKFCVTNRNNSSHCAQWHKLCC